MTRAPTIPLDPTERAVLLCIQELDDVGVWPSNQRLSYLTRGLVSMRELSRVVPALQAKGYVSVGRRHVLWRTVPIIQAGNVPC